MVKQLSENTYVSYYDPLNARFDLTFRFKKDIFKIVLNILISYNIGLYDPLKKTTIGDPISWALSLNSQRKHYGYQKLTFDQLLDVINELYDLVFLGKESSSSDESLSLVNLNPNERSGNSTLIENFLDNPENSNILYFKIIIYSRLSITSRQADMLFLDNPQFKNINVKLFTDTFEKIEGPLRAEHYNDLFLREEITRERKKKYLNDDDRNRALLDRKLQITNNLNELNRLSGKGFVF